MNPTDPRLCRSLLFLPASNSRAIAKAQGLAADMLILDLEDAVKPEDKDTARAAAVDAVRAGFAGRLVAIRVNAPGDAWYAGDVAAVRSSAADFVVLPKAGRPAEAQAAADATGKPVLAMIETAAGVLAAAAIAPCTAGLIAGTNDLSADLGMPAGAGRDGLMLGLQTIVLAARVAGVAAFDGVWNRLDDPAGLERQCEQGRAWGFDGKSLIHPDQIATANRAFGPSADEIAAAHRLIAAASGGAERFEGRMIEAMHVRQAEDLLAKARL